MIMEAQHLHRRNINRLHAVSHGFTLLELLVVLLIIGITLGFASLSIGDRGREQAVEQEAQRLVGRLTLAAQESVLQGKEMALEISDDSYRFVVLDEDEWRALDEDEILRVRSLPAALRLKLKIEGESVDLEQKKDADKPEDVPRIYLFSSGEMTPFELTLLDEYGSNYRVRGAANGKLKVLKLAHESKT